MHEVAPSNPGRDKLRLTVSSTVSLPVRSSLSREPHHEACAFYMMIGRFTTHVYGARQPTGIPVPGTVKVTFDMAIIAALQYTILTLPPVYYSVVQALIATYSCDPCAVTAEAGGRIQAAVQSATGHSSLCGHWCFAPPRAHTRLLQARISNSGLQHSPDTAASSHRAGTLVTLRPWLRSLHARDCQKQAYPIVCSQSTVDLRDLRDHSPM